MKRHRTAFDALLARNSVAVALHILADGDGLSCEATDREIAAQSGYSVGIVRRGIQDLEERGMVAVFYSPQWPGGRSIVLLDNEDADTWIVSFYTKRDEYPRLSEHSTAVRKKVERLTNEFV